MPTPKISLGNALGLCRSHVLDVLASKAAEFRIRPPAERVVVRPTEREAQTKGVYRPGAVGKERPSIILN